MRHSPPNKARPYGAERFISRFPSLRRIRAILESQIEAHCLDGDLDHRHEGVAHDPVTTDLSVLAILRACHTVTLGMTRQDEETSIGPFDLRHLVHIAQERITDPENEVQNFRTGGEVSLCLNFQEGLEVFGHLVRKHTTTMLPCH